MEGKIEREQLTTFIKYDANVSKRKLNILLKYFAYYYFAL